MKYKVGDRVRVKKDLVLGKRYGSVNCLLGHEKESGKIFTISCSSEHSEKDYRLNGNNYWWSEEMFEEVDKMGNVKIKIAVDGNEVIAKMGKETGIARCSPEDEFDLFTGVKLALERLEKQCKPYAWLKEGMRYYRPNIYNDRMYVCTTYYNDDNDKRLMSRGLVFKTVEEAINCAKKMLAVLKEG